MEKGKREDNRTREMQKKHDAQGGKAKRLSHETGETCASRRKVKENGDGTQTPREVRPRAGLAARMWATEPPGDATSYTDLA